jgi:hypothetical protein
MARCRLPVLILMLAACGDREESDRLRSELASARDREAAAVTALAQAQKEREALAAEVDSLREKLEAVKTARADAERERDRVQEAGDRLAAHLAGSLETRKRVLAAGAAAEQEKKHAVEMALENSRAEREVLERKVESLEARVKDLEASLDAKDQELTRVRAQADRVQAQADAFRRLLPGKKAVLTPDLILPVSYDARKGETLRWSWAVVEAPEDLDDEAVEFYVLSPGGGRAYSVRAGRKKVWDEGGIRLDADGIWTAVWANRHPTARITIQYTVLVVPAR